MFSPKREVEKHLLLNPVGRKVKMKPHIYEDVEPVSPYFARNKTFQLKSLVKSGKSTLQEVFKDQSHKLRIGFKKSLVTNLYMSFNSIFTPEVQKQLIDLILCSTKCPGC